MRYFIYLFLFYSRLDSADVQASSCTLPNNLLKCSDTHGQQDIPTLCTCKENCMKVNATCNNKLNGQWELMNQELCKAEGIKTILPHNVKVSYVKNVYEFQCEIGYSITGPSTAICNTESGDITYNNNNNTLPTCEEIRITFSLMQFVYLCLCITIILSLVFFVIYCTRQCKRVKDRSRSSGVYIVPNEPILQRRTIMLRPMPQPPPRSPSVRRELVQSRRRPPLPLPIEQQRDSVMEIPEAFRYMRMAGSMRNNYLTDTTVATETHISRQSVKYDEIIVDGQLAAAKLCIEGAVCSTDSAGYEVPRICSNVPPLSPSLSCKTTRTFTMSSN